MNAQDTIRSWKDEDFAATLTGIAPASPVGHLVELNEQQLEVSGGIVVDTIMPILNTLFGPCPTGDFVPCTFGIGCQDTVIPILED
jgi:mersacidin/lichenicidin family type 2 lantibiotic